MNSLSDLRQSLIDIAGWDPAPNSAGVTRLNRFLNLAHRQMALDAKYLFEDEIRMTIRPPVSSASASDTITVSSTRAGDDFKVAHVFRTDLTVGDTPRVDWKYDRTWDGRMIDIIDPTTGAVLHTTRIRGIRRNGTPGSLLDTDTIWFGVWVPFDRGTHGDGPFKYRVYDDEYYLPNNFIEMRHGRIVEGSTIWNISVIGQREAEERFFAEDYDDTHTGVPRFIFNRGFERPIRPPKVAATAVLSASSTLLTDEWKGPEPPGQFDYVYTISFGKRPDSRAGGRPYWDWTGEGYSLDPVENRDTKYVENWGKNRILEPFWESPPAPVSDKVTVSSIVASGTAMPDAVVLTFPAIDYLAGLASVYQKGSLTVSQVDTYLGTAFITGLNVRVYRRRYTEDFTNYSTLGATSKTSETTEATGLNESNLDIDDAYYLIAETPAAAVTSLPIPFFVDDGQLIPDYNTKLEEFNGYRRVRVYPQPDQEYEMALRVVKSAKKMVANTDTPDIPVEASDALVYKALTYLYEYTKEPGAKAAAEAKYVEELKKLAKSFGDLRPENQVSVRRAARAGHYRSSYYQWWNNTDGNS